MDLHEREKEVLRQQITFLEEQVAKMNSEHNKALEELRRASEIELVHIKKQMELRVEKHMKTERELKDTLCTVDSADKEELLEKIERLEAEKKSDRSGGLREVQKKEDLLQRISQLEKNERELIKEHEMVLLEVRAQNDAEIRHLRKEIEKQKSMSMEKERELQQAIRSTESFEKEELLQKIERLEDQLDNERNGATLVKMKLTALEKEAKHVEQQLRKELDLAIERREEEIRHLQEQISELKSSEIDKNALHMIEALQNADAEKENEAQQLHQSLEEMSVAKAACEAELRKIKASVIANSELAAEKEELLKKINELEEELGKERADATWARERLAAVEHEATVSEIDLRAQLTASEKSIKCMQQELAEKLAMTQSQDDVKNERDSLLQEVECLKTTLESERRDRTAEIEALRVHQSEDIRRVTNESSERLRVAEQESKARIKSLETRIDAFQAELARAKESKSGCSFAEEQALREELASVTEQAKRDRTKYEQCLKQIQDDHAKESEELLAQLDLVEAEHKEKLQQVSKGAAEKDALITSLKQQISEMEMQIKDAVDSRETLKSDFERVQEERIAMSDELKSVKEDLDLLKATHATLVKTSEAAKQQACEKARLEMIDRAEAEFKQANDLYVKLKKQYDLCKKKLETLELELKKARGAVKKLETAETDFRRQISQLKESKIKVETEAAQKTKEYRRELERLLQAAADFEAKLKESETSNRQAQRKLATAAAEKAQLQKEYNDMKSVCEELMAMVEGQQHEC